MSDPALPIPGRHALAGLCLLTVTCYLGLMHAGFVYDDDWTIEHNSTIRSFARIPALLEGDAVRGGVPDAWRPLMVISHMIDYRLFGLRPAGYHLHSLAWHLGCVLMLWLLVLRVFGRPLLALTAAALFAVHPINVEAVAAINYREDLLATFFGLAALLVMLRPARSLRWSAPLAAVLLLCGLAAKETAAVVPLLYVVLQVSRADRGGRLRSALPGALALGGAVVIYLGWRLVTAGSISPYPAGLPRPPWPTHAEAILRTLAQLVIPAGLSPEYVQPARPWLSLAAAGSLLGLIAIVVIAARLASTRRTLIEGIGLLWLLIAWLPTSGLFALPNARADRYAYLPSIGFCLAVAAVLARISKPRARALVSGLAVLVLVIVTVNQVRVWRSDRTVWQRATAIAPATGRAWAGLARAAAVAGDLPAAALHAERGLALSPGSGLVHLVAANIQARQGTFEAAFKHYARAAQLEVHNPGHLFTSWGLALLLAGRPAEAEAKLRQAILRSPDLAEAHAALARVLTRLGRRAEARAALERAFRLAPETSE